MRNIRAIIINSLDKTITEAIIPADFDAIKRDLIQCQWATKTSLGGGVDAWIDDEGLLVDWDHQTFCKIAGQLTLAGNVVLTGVQDGPDGPEMGNLPDFVTVGKLRQIVEFIAPQDVSIPGSTITTRDEAGNTKTEHLGPHTLTYDNH